MLFAGVGSLHGAKRISSTRPPTVKRIGQFGQFENLSRKFFSDGCAVGVRRWLSYWQNGFVVGQRRAGSGCIVASLAKGGQNKFSVETATGKEGQNGVLSYRIYLNAG
jgi:hypothetical protein